MGTRSKEIRASEWRQRNRPELCRLKDVPKPKLTGLKTRTTERIFDVSRDSDVLQNTVLGCKPQEVRVKIAELCSKGLCINKLQIIHLQI